MIIAPGRAALGLVFFQKVPESSPVKNSTHNCHYGKYFAVFGKSAMPPCAARKYRAAFSQSRRARQILVYT